MPSISSEGTSNPNILLTSTKKIYPIYPEIPKIPKSKKDTRKYPIVYFDTPTRTEPEPLPGILSNTQPDIEKPYPLGTDSDANSRFIYARNMNPLRCTKILKEKATQFNKPKIYIHINQSGGALRKQIWWIFVNLRTGGLIPPNYWQPPYLIFVIFLHKQNFWRLKFTPKNANFSR